MDDYDKLLADLEEAVDREAPASVIECIEEELFRIEWEAQAESMVEMEAEAEAEAEATYSRELAAIQFMDDQMYY